ncbi:MAG: hypothetical protein M1824_003329 [Vezdaea acicularis]|nr:MAG: hypothetical protein M1824_003329 [Vezdaea acicularis]
MDGASLTMIALAKALDICESEELQTVASKPLRTAGAPSNSGEAFTDESWKLDSENPSTGLSLDHDSFERLHFLRSVSNLTSGLNSTQWDKETQSACINALDHKQTEASPAGIATCYNVAYLDNSTGIFQADLRLFRVSDPSGIWLGIPSQSVGVSLGFANATILVSSAATMQGALGKMATVRSVPPKTLHILSLVAQLSSNISVTSLGRKEIRSSLTPVVTLIAISALGLDIQSALTPDNASFLNGVLTTPSEDDLEWPKTDGQYDLSGPLLVGIWAALIVVINLFGLSGRYKAREKYRRQQRRTVEGVAIEMRML